MTLVRRHFLQFAAGATVLPIVSNIARADAFPDRPVHIVTGFAPGGVGDIAARLISQPLQQRLNQSFVVDNRPGAGRQCWRCVCCPFGAGWLHHVFGGP
jgi:tripartite-type tricarboxylate transporter receptor subunit TctC